MSALYTAKLSPLELKQFLADNVCLQGKLLLAFALDRFWFEKFTGETDLLDTTEQGRIFGPWGECYWRWIDEQYTMVYLGEDELTSEQLQDYSQELCPSGKRA